MIFIERYPLKRCQGCVKLIASKVNCFLNINDLSEVQLCMSSNSWTWECPHTKDGADHVPLILLRVVCILPRTCYIFANAEKSSMFFCILLFDIKNEKREPRNKVKKRKLSRFALSLDGHKLYDWWGRGSQFANWHQWQTFFVGKFTNTTLIWPEKCTLFFSKNGQSLKSLVKPWVKYNVLQSTEGKSSVLRYTIHFVVSKHIALGLPTANLFSTHPCSSTFDASLADWEL